MKGKPVIIKLISLVVMFVAPITAMSQQSNTLLGTWKTIDENDGSTAYVAFHVERSRVRGAFVDSVASQACGDVIQTGAPFIATVETNLYPEDLDPGKDLVFEAILTGYCQDKKTRGITFQLLPIYLGESDSLLMFGTEWQRFDFEPDLLVDGLEELRFTTGWLVADLVLDPNKYKYHNAICSINSRLGVDNSESQALISELAFESPESSCHDLIDNDCDGLVDGEDSDCFIIDW